MSFTQILAETAQSASMENNEMTEPNWARERLNILKSGTLDLPPVVLRLGLGALDEWEPGWFCKTWSPETDHLHPDGTLFGGITAALADQALSFAAMTVIANDKAMRTLNLSTQFFKLAYADPLVIEGQVLNHSRRIISAEITFAREDGTMLAKSSGQVALTDFPKM